MRSFQGCEQDFWPKVQRCAHGWACQTCCWPWQGSCDQKGYGQFSSHGTQIRTNRFLVELRDGALLLSPAFLACHTCDNPPCCNWHHLYVGTAKDNAQDAVRRERGLGTSAGSRAQKWWLAVDALCTPLPRYTALGVFLRLGRARRRCSLLALAQALGVRRMWLHAIEGGNYMAWTAWRHTDFHQKLAALWRITAEHIPPFDGRPDWHATSPVAFDITPLMLPLILGDGAPANEQLAVHGPWRSAGEPPWVYR
jgi:hypothetical protein